MLLDATAGGREVACHRETYHTAVRELDLLLHQALAERTAADDGAAVIVLDGTGENL